MSPIVAAAAGLALVGVGVAAGRWSNRHEAAWRHAMDLERIAHLAGELAEAERIIRDFTRQRLDDADADDWPLPDRVLLPPRKWAALREAQEHWMEN